MKKRTILIIAASALVLVLALLIVLNQRSAIRYNHAQNLLSDRNFEKAGEAFDALGEYEESSKLTMYSRACAAAEAGDYYTASQAFDFLGDYKDCKLLTVYYSAWQYELNGESSPTSYILAIKQFRELPLFRDADEHITACQKKAYDSAIALGDQEEYSTAVSVLNNLGYYLDSKKQADYYSTRNLLKSGQYLSALSGFKKLGDFRDSADWLEKTKEETYRGAEKLLEKQDFTKAYELFEALGDYSDAKDRILKSKYERAEAFDRDGNYKLAYSLWEELGDYADSKDRILKSKYERAEKLLGGQNYVMAYSLWEELGDYADSKDRILKSKYERAEKLLDEQEYAAAYWLWEEIGDYADSKDRILRSKYERADALLEKKQYDDAYELFGEVGDYGDAASRILQSKYDRAEALLEAGRYSDAYALFNEIPDYMDAAERILKSKYERAAACMETYDFDSAETLYRELGEYEDSAERLNSITTAKQKKLAEDYKTAGRYLEARDAYLVINDEQNAQECSYLYAVSIENTMPWEAWNLFLELSDYSDSRDRAAKLYPRRYTETGKEDENKLRIFRDPETGLCGLLDANADIAVDPVFAEIRNGLNGNYIVKSAGNEGVMKPDGTMLISADYSSVSVMDNTDYLVLGARGFGVMNAEGQTVIECGFTSIELNEDGLFAVTGEQGTGLFLADGSVLIPAEYTGIRKTGNGYSVEKGNRVGLLSEDGSVIIAAQYDRIEQLPDGRYRVSNEGKTGLLSADGKIIVSALYDSIADMEDGRYLVSINSLQGILAADGSAVITPAYQSIILENTGNYTVTLDGKSGIVSYEGKILHEADMEELRSGSNDGKYMIFRQDGLYGFMKADTFEVNVPAEWKDVHIMFDGYAYILNNLDQWGVIDAAGNVTVKPAWGKDKLVCYEDCGCAVYQYKKLLDNKGQLLCDFGTYNTSTSYKVKYQGNGVFAEGYDGLAIYDTKDRKLYAYDFDGIKISKLTMFENGMLSGNIPYKKSNSSYTREYAYGVIDSGSEKILSATRWGSIYSVPGVAVKDNKYGWIGKDGRDLIGPKYNYIRGAAENGKIIAANYNDRGNLVYEVIDDTTGKVLVTGIASETEALDQCWPEGKKPEMAGGDKREAIIQLVMKRGGYSQTDYEMVSDIEDIVYSMLESGRIQFDSIDWSGFYSAFEKRDAYAMLDVVGHFDEILDTLGSSL